MNKLAVTLEESKDLIVKCIKTGLVPIVTSSPGVGKSSIAQQIAKDFNLKVIDIRLAQCDPVDLNGFPKLDGTKASYLPFDTFPIEGDTVPTGYDGWLLLLDELNSAPKSVQAAAYKIVLDRQVGQHNLHKKVAIIAAGNLATDKAVVHSMSTALQSRLVHLEVKVDKDTWINWALAQKLDTRVISFIDFRPELLHSFDPSKNDTTFPCPRTWEFASKIMKLDTSTKIPKGLISLLGGTIGEGTAREFLGFLEVYTKLPSIAQIIKDPKNTQVPTEAATQYALSGYLADNINQQNADSIMDYLDRMGIEFQVIAIRKTYLLNPSLVNHPRLDKWIDANSKRFA